MEAEAHPLIPRISQRTFLQAGLFVAAFATAGSLAVVFRPGRVERPASRVAVAIAPAPKMVQARAVAIDRAGPPTSSPLAAAMAMPQPAPVVAAAPQRDEAARARAALADALKASQQKDALLTAQPMSAAAFAPPLQAAAPGPVPAAGGLRGSISSFAAAQKPVEAPGSALASIDRAAPLTDREPMKQADLQRMAANAARSIRTGDIAGARLILRRAAEGGDATALFALAETYDPRVLEKMRVRGLSGDPAQAKALYEKAAAAGVTAARSRLTQQ